jgi:hypothetical protein
MGNGFWVGPASLTGPEWLPGGLLSTHPIRAFYEPGLPFHEGHFRNLVQKPPYFVQVFWEFAIFVGFWPVGAFCVAV